MTITHHNHVPAEYEATYDAGNKEFLGYWGPEAELHETRFQSSIDVDGMWHSLEATRDMPYTTAELREVHTWLGKLLTKAEAVENDLKTEGWPITEEAPASALAVDPQPTAPERREQPGEYTITADFMKQVIEHATRIGQEGGSGLNHNVMNDITEAIVEGEKVRTYCGVSFYPRKQTPDGKVRRPDWEHCAVCSVMKTINESTNS